MNEINMDPHELIPLEDGHLPITIRPARRLSRYTSRSCIRAPLKVVRLFLLLIILPTALIVVPLYMRYRVFSSQMYPMGMTDMRLIDGKISPTWCQKQVVKSNTTFNAYVVPEQPRLADELVPVSMTRTLELEDDMKEYWGFYLLQGSTVTVSPCVRFSIQHHQLIGIKCMEKLNFICISIGTSLLASPGCLLYPVELAIFTRGEFREILVYTNRWPGASLVMIKGYKHLKECAYIGDDSSEELDELLEANKLGLLSNISLYEKILQLKKEDGKANHPETMKRHKAGVSFHDPSQLYNDTSSASVPAVDVTDHDPKELREILEHLHAIQNSIKQQKAKSYQPPDHLMALPGLHRHRDTNVDKDERQWLSFKDIDANSVERNKTETNDSAINPTKVTDDYEIVTIKVDKNFEVESDKTTEVIKDLQFYENDSRNNINGSKEEISTTAKPSLGSYEDNKNTELDDTSTTLTIESNIIIEENKNLDNENDDSATKIENNNYKSDMSNPYRQTFHDDNNIINLKEKSYVDAPLDKQYSTANESDENRDAELSSREVFEDVLDRLHRLGPRGKRVLKRLQKTMGMTDDDEKSSEEAILDKLTGSDEELDRLRQVLVEAIDEEKRRPQREEKRRKAAADARHKRELMLGDALRNLTRELNDDDEARDYAAEEDLEPDGYAEHHTRVNETTPLDMSNSEFWSSFSSSEEALLECEGLILNLPLSPSPRCHADQTEEQLKTAASKNSLTYRVPANGYYFFVFNSENEVQTNYIHVRFDLQKTRYDLARTALRECRNSTEKCELLLDIFSSQKVVLELPYRDNQSLWNEQFVVISECEPRTSIYLACVIAVPVLIMVFAFQ